MVPDYVSHESLSKLLKTDVPENCDTETICVNWTTMLVTTPKTLSDIFPLVSCDGRQIEASPVESIFQAEKHKGSQINSLFIFIPNSLWEGDKKIDEVFRPLARLVSQLSPKGSTIFQSKMALSDIRFGRSRPTGLITFDPKNVFLCGVLSRLFSPARDHSPSKPPDDLVSWRTALKTHHNLGDHILIIATDKKNMITELWHGSVEQIDDATKG